MMMSDFLKKLEDFCDLRETEEVFNMSDHLTLLKGVINSQLTKDVKESIKSLMTDILSEGTEEDKNITHSSVKYLLEKSEIKEFVVRKKKRRRKPNSKLSRIAKMRYRKNKASYKRSLKKFHKSSKGKAFHKALGKYNSKRTRRESTEQVQELKNEINELIVTASAALTQFFVFIKNNPENDVDVDTISLIKEVFAAILDDYIESLSSDSIEDLEQTYEEILGELEDLFTEEEIEFEN